LTDKNIRGIIELIKKLPKSEFVVLFVGSGSLENELKQKAPNNCIFLGFQNQSVMPIIYRMADVFVLPSVGPGETWGLAMNEALACGVPVIASEKCGWAIDLINSSNGMIVKNLNTTTDVILWLRGFIKNNSRFKQSLSINTYRDSIDSILRNLK
jgi:glycosyltransferase involved in cell wall biosynthesis